MTTPASGQRRAAYFRTTFTVPPDNGPLVRPVVRCLIDDGAYVYIDGELVAAVNMPDTTPPNRDTYATQNAANATDTEDELRLLELSLPDGSPTGAAPADAALAENSRIVKQLLGLSVGEHTLAVSLRSNSQTSSDLAMAIELSAEVGCIIVADASNVVRSDAGTPANPSDDTFSFDVVVTGTGGGASWSSPVPGGTSRAYDVPVTLGPFPVSQSPVTVTLTAAADPACTTEVTATAPTASISATATSSPATSVAPSIRTTTPSPLWSRWIRSSPRPPGRARARRPSSRVPGHPAPVSMAFRRASDPMRSPPDPSRWGSWIAMIPDCPRRSPWPRPPSSAASPSGARRPTCPRTGRCRRQWASNGATPPTLTMSNPGDDEWHEFRSEVLDLSAIGSLGLFRGVRCTRDQHRQQLRRPRGLPGAAPPDRRRRAGIDRPLGRLRHQCGRDAERHRLGSLRSRPRRIQPLQEPESVALHNLIPLAALVPAAADSVQLVIEGKGLSNSEYFDVRPDHLQ